ncbi:hypothetical protein IL306_001394 [Fusarium sp. DS 682]|nr:hypothetical protein IL306_001394 [Fusarium sp. DS 682]
MSLSKCCLEGTLWDGEPVGEEKTYSGQQAYVSGNNPETAILLVHDAFGWTFRNTRLLADRYAKEANATVYMPDFYGGEVLPTDILMNLSQLHKLDMPGFMARNSKEVRGPELVNFAAALRSQYKRVGAVGFCWGGWAVFRLGARSSNGLVDCISTAHPSLLEESEVKDVGVPVQILAPENDFMFSPEMKGYVNRVIPSLGVAYDYQHFPGVEHGFATRGGLKADEYAAATRATTATVSWLRLWLHGKS